MAESRVIEILGPGCAKCEMLARHTEQAVRELGLNDTVVKTRDPVAMMRYGVMSTPALVIDGQVKLAGRVFTAEKLKEYLR